MLKKTKKTRQKQRRPIEEVPFYKFEYKFDDLPLDPARPFILEQISEFQISLKTFRGEFVSDVTRNFLIRN